jgi:mRNA interferase MazF
MRRGEIWTVSGSADYAGKPRPVVVVQDDLFRATDSVTICPFTSDPADLPLFRVAIEPSDTNGLRLPSQIMADKVTTVRRSKLGSRIGRLGDRDMLRLNRAVMVFLGLAS